MGAYFHNWLPLTWFLLVKNLHIENPQLSLTHLYISYITETVRNRGRRVSSADMTETSSCINNNFIRDPTSTTTTNNSNSTSTTSSSTLHPSHNSMKTHQSQSSPQQQMEQQTQPQRRLIKADLDLLYSLDTRVSTFLLLNFLFSFHITFFIDHSLVSSSSSTNPRV